MNTTSGGNNSDKGTQRLNSSDYTAEYPGPVSSTFGGEFIYDGNAAAPAIGFCILNVPSSGDVKSTNSAVTNRCS